MLNVSSMLGGGANVKTGLVKLMKGTRGEPSERVAEIRTSSLSRSSQDGN